MQQASSWKGNPLLWILPLYQHVNKKSDDDDDDDEVVLTIVLNISFYGETIKLIPEPSSDPNVSGTLC